MAEALAQRAVDARGWRHVEVSSAGAAAVPGAPASEGALRAAARNGLDLTGHRSTPLSREVVLNSDLILTMAPGHLRAVQLMGGEERATLLTSMAMGEEVVTGGMGVPDPIGGDDEEYDATFRTLEALVERVLGRLEPILSP